MPAVPNQRWSCHSCGDCCRTLVGHLFPHERNRLDADGWAEKLGVAPYIRLGRQRVLNKRPDGACVFLDDKNRCRIHTELGEDAKPLACRIFPFTVRPTEQGWQAALRFDCPSATDSRGDPIARHEREVQTLADSMPHIARRERTRLKGRLKASSHETEGLTQRLVRFFDRDNLPTGAKVVVLARLASALANARLTKVRDDRFLELVDILIGGFAAESKAPFGRPSTTAQCASPRQYAMARQFVLACSEHVSLSELKQGVVHRWRKRADQLSRAKRFLRGSGVVPPLRGFSNQVTFEEVSHVAGATQETHEIDDLLMRYIRARLAGTSVFGAGYYDWPVVSGLGALAMCIVSIGWVARYVAAHDGRGFLKPSDVNSAVRVIDRGVTRVRALGTMTERGRIAYLMEEEGVAKLVDAFWMVEMK